jgi:hypothetical protein
MPAVQKAIQKQPAGRLRYMEQRQDAGKMPAVRKAKATAKSRQQNGQFTRALQETGGPRPQALPPQYWRAGKNWTNDQ